MPGMRPALEHQYQAPDTKRGVCVPEVCVEVKMPTETQISLLKHAIGYKRNRVKRGKYTAYRNHFAAPAADQAWEDLIRKGLAIRHDVDGNYIYYGVSKAGLELLERLLEVKIITEEGK